MDIFKVSVNIAKKRDYEKDDNAMRELTTNIIG